MADAPVYIETEAFSNASQSASKAVIIWLHGLGADGHDFVPLAHAIGTQTNLPLRFIFPHAPSRPVTINQGYSMPAWYDITGFGFKAREDKKGLEETQAAIFKLIEDQIQAGIKPSHIFLGGFSQGGAAVLYAGLRYPEKLGGLIALSAYLPFSGELPSLIKSDKSVPIFMGYGLNDTVVFPDWTLFSVNALKKAGFSVDLHAYATMAHSVCEQESQDLCQWLMVCLN